MKATVYKNDRIPIDFEIFKGTSNVREDFSRALLKVFLVTRDNKYVVQDFEAVDGIIAFMIPEELCEGSYSLEAIWLKNWEPVSVKKGIERNPHDIGFSHDSLMRARHDFAFSVTEYEEERTVYPGERIHVKSNVASYGYDGLGAYELSVMRGVFSGTEEEFIHLYTVNVEHVDEMLPKIEKAKSDADNAIEKANEANAKADNAIANANEANAKADNANAAAVKAVDNANAAAAKAREDGNAAMASAYLASSSASEIRQFMYSVSASGDIPESTIAQVGENRDKIFSVQMQEYEKSRTTAKYVGGLVPVPYRFGYYDTTDVSVGNTIYPDDIYKTSNKTICWLIALDGKEKYVSLNVYGNTIARRRWIILDELYNVIDVAGNSQSFVGNRIIPENAKYFLINNIIDENPEGIAYARLNYGIGEYAEQRKNDMFDNMIKELKLSSADFENYGGTMNYEPIMGCYFDLSSVRSEGVIYDYRANLKADPNYCCWVIPVKKGQRIKEDVAGNIYEHRRHAILDKYGKVIRLSSTTNVWSGFVTIKDDECIMIVNNSFADRAEPSVSSTFVGVGEINKEIDPTDTSGRGKRLSVENMAIVDGATTYSVNSFKVEKKDGVRYFASGRVGRADTPLVMYLDANGTPIGYQFADLVNEGEITSYPHTLVNVELTLPSGTNTIMVQGGLYDSGRCFVSVPTRMAVEELEDKISSISNKTKKDIKILGIGNSWTRDALRWLYAIAVKSGVKQVVVGHAYLGGSTLAHQYFGMDDEDYVYSHDGVPQKVHSTYQYWKYYGEHSNLANDFAAKKTPSTGYNNGLAGIGVTLQSVIADEDWDYVVMMPTMGYLGDITYWDRTDKSEGRININDFVARIKEEMDEDTLAKVKFGLACPWTWSDGTTRVPSKSMIDIYNHGVDIDMSNTAEVDKFLHNIHDVVQKSIIRLADYMGDNCNFIINSGLAIYNARNNSALVKCGYKCQRAKDNTHLAEGMPMYVASLTYAYELFGLDRREIDYYPTTTSNSVDGDVGNSDAVITPTSSIADQAKKTSWVSQMCSL